MTPYEMEPNPLVKMRLVSLIPRWSVVPVVRRQTNGEHIFLVARYAAILNKALGFSDDIEMVYEHALSHDDAEAVHGDLPSGSPLQQHKHDSEEIEYPLRVMAIVKLADRLEAYLYCREESKLGNQYMIQLEPEIRKKLVAAALRVPGAEEYLMEVFK